VVYNIKNVYISVMSILYCTVDTVIQKLMDKNCPIRNFAACRGKMQEFAVLGHIREFCKLCDGIQKFTSLIMHVDRTLRAGFSTTN